jgi:hypothetical protein
MDSQEIDKAQPFPTNRDLILALFNAVGALALKLTGERLVVGVGNPAETNYVQLYSSPSSTSWKVLGSEGQSTEEEKGDPCRSAASRCIEP